MPNLIKKIRTESGDLQIDYNALANLPTISNPNLLINSDFRINQRGGSVYQQVNKWTYSVDRWRYIGLMSVTVNDSGTVTIAKTDNSDATYFSQVFETTYAQGAYTMSVSVKSITGTMTAYIGGGSSEMVEITEAGVYEIHSTQYANGVVFRLDGSTTSVELEWAKLEQGTTATPFVPRLYGEELALCQRFYEERTLVFTPLSGGVPSSNYIAVNGGQHFVVKRAVPTVTIGTLYDYTGADSGAVVNSYTCTANSLRAINLSASCNKYMLRAAVTFDAEIY